MGLPGGVEDAAIAEAIIVLARTLKMVVVADGVETEAQADALRRLGCQYGQGHLFSRPLPPDRLAAFIADAQEAAQRAPAG